MVSVATLVLTSACYEKESPNDDSPDLATDTDGSTMTSPSGGPASGETDGSGPGEGPGSDSEGDADADGTATDGDTDEPTDSGGEVADLDDLIGSLCDWEFRCCSEGELDYRLGPFTKDVMDCQARYVEQVESNDDVAESQAGGLLNVLGFGVRLDRSDPNPDAIEACKEQVDLWQCNQPFDGTVVACEPTDLADNPCDLRNLFTGKQTVGDLCSEALAAIDIECEAGSSCELKDGTYVCVDKGLQDEFCEADQHCDQGLFCDLGAGKCAPRSVVGEPCHFDDLEQPDAGTETLPCVAEATCDPQQERCVQYCSRGYDCVADSQCPSGDSCIPVDIGDHTYTYCLERGDTNGDRCDSDHDCADAFHCNGDSCRADLAQGTACALTQECQEGLYCATFASGECEIVINAGNTCVADEECNTSTTIGCITSDDGQLCRTVQLDNGDACVPGENLGGNWCESGVCEDVTDDGIANPECHDGAGPGEECDEFASTLDVHRCADGSFCHPDDEVCVLQLDAGGDCSDEGGQQCLNGQCSYVWEDDYCTDAPYSAEVATCDGED